MRKNSRALNCHTAVGEREQKKEPFFHSLAQQILCRFGFGAHQLES